MDSSGQCRNRRLSYLVAVHQDGQPHRRRDLDGLVAHGFSAVYPNSLKAGLAHYENDMWTQYTREKSAKPGWTIATVALAFLATVALAY